MDPNQDALYNVRLYPESREPKEVMGEIQPEITLDLPDDKLVELINKKITEGSVMRQTKVLSKGQVNENYYNGFHVIRTLRDKRTKPIENLIFRNIETIVPILTSNTPEPKIYHPNRDFLEKLRKIFFLRWEVMDKMLDKSRKIIKHNFMRYIGVLKFRYDEDYNDICVEPALPETLVIDPNCTCYYDCDYVAQIIKYETVEEVLEKYPYGKAKLLKLLGAKSDKDKSILGTRISYTEFSTPKFTIWKYLNVVLDKQKNQNWDYGEAEEVDDYGKKTKKAFNILQKPTVPYIFFQTLNSKQNPFSDTSIIEQAIPMQDIVNNTIRQMVDNAEEAGGILTSSGDYMTKDEFSRITGAANERVWFGKGDPQKGLFRVAGNPLEQYTFQLLGETKQEIDNLMGAHSTTRGSSDTKTATQGVMDRQQDFGRIDDLVRCFESFSEDYFTMLLQMMIVHYNDVHYYPIQDEDTIEISRDILIKEFSKIPKLKEGELGDEYTYDKRWVAPIINVAKGSTLPTDDASRYQNAIQLWAAQGIDPLSLYEDMDDPNPERKALRLFSWKNAPQLLFPEMNQLNPEAAQQTGQPQYTPGMIADTKAIKDNQPLQINSEVKDPKTAEVHIQAHSKYIDSKEFKSLSKQVKARYVQHVQQEIAYVKQAHLQQGANQPASGVLPTNQQTIPSPANQPLPSSVNELQGQNG